MDSRFLETSESIVSQLGFKDLRSFIKNQALLMLLAKIEKYEAENRRFEEKYHMDFERFQKKIEGLREEEDFLEEDDYLDWRFAKEALKSLRVQRQTLEDA
jgi:hypothetical protein